MRPSTSRHVSLALVFLTLSTRTSAVPVPLDDLAGLTATLNSLTGAGGQSGGESNNVDNADVAAVVSVATDLLDAGSPTVVDAALAISLCQAVNSLSDLLGLGQAVLGCNNLPPVVYEPPSCDGPVIQAVEPEQTETWEPEPEWTPEPTWTPEALEEPEWTAEPEPEPTTTEFIPVVHAVNPPQPEPTTVEVLANPASPPSGVCVLDCVTDLLGAVVDTVTDVVGDPLVHLGVDSLTSGTLGGDGGLLNVESTADSVLHVATGGDGGLLDGVLGGSSGSPVAGVLNVVTAGSNKPEVQPYIPPPPVPASAPIEPAAVAATPAEPAGGLLGVTSVTDSILHAGILRARA